MKKEFKVYPSTGIVLAKATAFPSALELTNSNLPKLEWKLEIEAVGSDCPSLVDENGKVREGHLILEYGDKFRQVISNNPLSWKVQSDYVKDNKLKLDRGLKIKIVEYMLIPYYNIMGVVDRDVILPEHTTVYDIKDEAKPITVNLNVMGIS